MPVPDTEQVARDIKNSVEALLISRTSFKERFSDTDEEWGAGRRSGPCASMQGLRAVFGAVAALPDDRELWAILKPALPSLLKEWATVLDELVQSRYGGSPYDTEMLDRLRKEVERDGSPYTDTVSWALSTAVIVNYVFPLFRKNGINVDPTLTTRTRDEIAKSLRTLINAQLTKTDGGWNWGSHADMNASHLFFTWSVIQGLADYFDYVLGESAAEIDVPVDHDTKAYLEERDAALEQDAIAARDRAARFLRDRYFGVASTMTGLTYADLAGKDGEGRERISVVANPNNEIPLLYFYSYLLEGLILSNYDKNDPAVVKSRRAEMDRLYAEIKRRFALVRPAGAAGTLDPDASTMQLSFTGTVKWKGSIAEVKIKDPSLWPQILRSLVLYSYYVETPRYADEDIVGATGAYALLVADRRDGEGVGAHLWDKLAFNLSVSVRALEGLIDIYDYVRLMTERNKEPEMLVGDLAQVIAEAIYPHVRLRLHGDPQAIPVTGPPPQIATESAIPVSEVHIQRLALDASEAQSVANFTGAERLLSDRLKTIDIDRAVKKVIGERHEAISSDNPVVYDLLRSVIVICMATVSGLFAEVLQEAILSTAQAKDLVENDRMYRGPDALGNRITMAVRQLAIHEVSKAQNRETWDVAELIKQVLALSAVTPPSPQPPRGPKRASA